MADHSKPTLTSKYADFLAEMNGRLSDMARGFDPAHTSATSMPTNTVRWASASRKWQRWNGTAWVDLASSYAISITGSAAKLTTARSIALSGGATGSASFDGSQNITINVTDLSPSALSSPVPVDKGGTGATTTGQARAALELGSAAQLTATTSATDSTVGRALRVGDFGIGRTELWLQDANTQPTHAGFLKGPGVTGLNFPGSTAYGQGLDLFRGVGNSTRILTYVGSNRAEMFIGSPDEGYSEVFHTRNFNPDNYVPRSGGAMTGRLVGGMGTTNLYGGSSIEVRGNGAAVYPSLSFHNPGAFASTLSLRANGSFYFNNQSGTLAAVYAGAFHGSGAYLTNIPWAQVASKPAQATRWPAVGEVTGNWPWSRITGVPAFIPPTTQGAVGTYMLLQSPNSTVQHAGTIAGSAMRRATVTSIDQSGPAGTWRNMGPLISTGLTGLFVRIS